MPIYLRKIITARNILFRDAEMRKVNLVSIGAGRLSCFSEQKTVSTSIILGTSVFEQLFRYLFA